MKRFLRISSVLIMIIIMLLPINYGCVCVAFNPQFLSEFVTQYSEEEHLERVKEIASRKLPKYYLIDIKTEILYAYYRGTPEYVLITAEYSEEFSDSFSFYENGRHEYEFKTKYLYTVIRIYKDVYEKTWLYRECEYDKVYYEPLDTAFMYGPNPYQVCGYGEEFKKYYTNDRFAIERDGKIMEFYRYERGKDSVYTLGLEPYDFSEKEININEQRDELYDSYYRKYYTFSMMFENNEFK